MSMEGTLISIHLSKATTIRAKNATVNDVDKAGVSCLCTLRYTLISIRRVAFILIYTSALRVRKKGGEAEL